VKIGLFFDEGATDATRFYFEEYIRVHLERRGVKNSMLRRRIFVCSVCRTPVSELQATRRTERGFKWISCNVCDSRVSLLDREERLAAEPKSFIAEMDRSADRDRNSQAASFVYDGKVATTWVDFRKESPDPMDQLLWGITGKRHLAV
jgi:hypothetical protein